MEAQLRKAFPFKLALYVFLLAAACGPTPAPVQEGESDVGAAPSAATFEEVQTIWASDGIENDEFADAGIDADTALAYRGDALIVAARGAAAAYVLRRVGGFFQHEAKLTLPGAPSPYFGRTVALDGDTAAVGSMNHVAVFERVAGVWTHTWTSGQFPKTVKGIWLSGDHLFTRQDSAIAVHRRENGAWTPKPQLVTPVDQYYLQPVALDGDTLARGVPQLDGDGAVYVFERAGDTWTSTVLVQPGFGTKQWFGSCVALAGDELLVGAAGTQRLYAFRRTNGAWDSGALVVESALEGFGAGCAMSGTAAVVAAVHPIDGATWYSLVRSEGGWHSTGDETESGGHPVVMQGATTVGGNFVVDVAGNGMWQGAAVVSDLVLDGLGKHCEVGEECKSGHCVDGVCCESACDGTCEACSAAAKGHGENGQCEPVEEGLDPHDSCSPQAAATCGRDGACDGEGQCRLHALGTPCAGGEPVCKDAVTVVHPPVCDGQGTCAPNEQHCGVFFCVGGECAPCTDHGQCQPGEFCDHWGSGQCLPKVENGGACGDDAACASGICWRVETCCETECEGGTCQDGTCDPIVTELPAGAEEAGACSLAGGARGGSGALVLLLGAVAAAARRRRPRCSSTGSGCTA